MSRFPPVAVSFAVAALVSLAAPPAIARAEPPPRKRPDVKFVATPMVVVIRMLRLAEVKKGDIVYDLGCGDGRIVVAAARWYGVRGVGIDIDPDRVRESRARARRSDVADRVTIKEGDLFAEDLGRATVITLYLLPKLNARLLPRLQKLRPGTRIVSHAFEIAGIKPKRAVKVWTREGIEHKLYLYVTPLEKAK